MPPGKCEALPLGPLLKLVGRSPTELARRSGIQPKTIDRWFAAGELPWFSADEIASRLGYHPCEVWGEAWEAA